MSNPVQEDFVKCALSMKTYFQKSMGKSENKN